jgi:polar amino acid transport system substrate-binding protein
MFKTASFSLLALALVAGLSLTACGKKEEAPAAAVPAPASKIVVGLDDNFPPMGFRDAKGNLVGFDIDLAREAAKRLGAEVEFKPIDWNAKEAELGGKRVDVLWNGLTITEPRKEKIAFTTPYLENRQIVIVAANSPVKAKADLAGKVVGVQEGSSAVEAIDKDAAGKTLKELKKFGDNVTALMDLSTGRLDALVVDEVVGRYYTACLCESVCFTYGFVCHFVRVGLFQFNTQATENRVKFFECQHVIYAFVALCFFSFGDTRADEDDLRIRVFLFSNASRVIHRRAGA